MARTDRARPYRASRLPRRALALLAGALCTSCLLDIPATQKKKPEPPEGPILFLSFADATAVRKRLGDEPWKSAAAELSQRAAVAATATPRSVTDDGAPKNGELNDFGTDSPGLPSPDRHDYLAGIDMATWSRELAVSYAVLGNAEHGARAVDLLVHWFVSPKTRMQPKAKNFGPQVGSASGSPIEIHLVIPPLLYATSLVWNHPAWTDTHPGARDAIVDWSKAFLTDLETQSFGAGSAHTWWVLARAATAALVESEVGLNAAFAEWRSAVKSIDADGYVITPTASNFGPSLFTLKPLVLTAELARHHGEDLYAHADASGVVLQRAGDLYAGFLLDESTWNGTVSSSDREENESMWELFNSAYQAAPSVAVIGAPAPERPHDEPRTLGPITLTHGDRFRLAPAGP